MSEFRIGHGFDVHRLVAGRALILAGETIPFERGLDGHSDADVVTHAIIDAILGAAGLPDIGQQFPDSEETYKDADSLELLRKAVFIVREAGVRQIVNVDATIMAERPKLSKFTGAMRTNLASAMSIDVERVNVKATTTEGLGFTGREEGIAASAVCLLLKNA